MKRDKRGEIRLLMREEYARAGLCWLIQRHTWGWSSVVQPMDEAG